MNSELFDKILEWTGTLLVIVSAAMVSFHIEPYDIYFLISAAAVWLWWSFRVKRNSLIIINGFNLIIYIAGLFVER